MWIVKTLALVVALAAAALAWQHATRLDRRSTSAWPGEPRDKQSSWGVALGALMAAVAATMMLQLMLLSGLGSAG